MIKARRIDLDADEYLRSLALTEQPTEVYGMDGAALYRVADDHFVMLTCTDAEHAAHKGMGLLRQVLPKEWRIFFAVTNPEQAFEAHHYGPQE